MNDKELRSVVTVISGELILIAISSMFSFFSLFMTKDIAYNNDDLMNAKYGWPVQYAIQNQDRFDPPYPWPMSYTYGTQTEFVISRFVVNTSFYFVINIFILSTTLVYIKKTKDKM